MLIVNVNNTEQLKPELHIGIYIVGKKIPVLLKATYLILSLNKGQYISIL